MFQRLLAICALAFLFTACETASNVAGDSASGSSSSSASGSATASASSSSTTATQMSDAEKLAQVGNTVYFGFDSSELAAEAQAILDRQAAFLNANPTMVVIIEGHADERGTREYNLALGERRAEGIQNYLIVNGASRSQIEIVSYGEEQPADRGSNDRAYQQNRRVQIVTP